MYCIVFSLKLYYVSTGALNLGVIVGGSAAGVSFIALALVVIIVVALLLVFRRDTKTASECYQCL